ncbi:ABC transporter substrate-binding protein [Desulfovibrio sp. OttesenSCG-928-G15]|nr:ABC transporter substrate-binding protein [Desulfovibrio sp. OttesenSCG-928-G15]
MNFRYTHFLLVMALSFFVTLIPPSVSVAHAAEPREVKVAYNPQTGNILSFICIEKGLDREEGVSYTLVPFSNSTDALTALQAGKVDVAVSFGTSAPLTFITKGADFTIFGGYVSGGMPVYARPDFDYKDMHSFEGQKVAVARMYTPEIVWRGAMAKAGIHPDEKCTVMEFKKPTEVLEAVKSGKADVGIGTNSTYLQAVAAGLKIVTWTNDLDPMHVCCRPVALTSWVKEKPDLVKGFLRAWIKAEAFLLANPEECVKINQKYLKLDEELARTMLLETNQIFESDPKTNGVRYMWKLLGDLNYADTKGIDIEQHLNASLYKEALDELTAKEPDNAAYRKFAERYVSYNQ